MRNLGGSVGIAILSTFLTHREQLHGARLGDIVTEGNVLLQQQVQLLTAYLTDRGMDAVRAQQQAMSLIDQSLQREAFTMAFNDAFMITGALLFATIVAVMFLHKPTSTTA